MRVMSEKVIIIAEVGTNHDGEIERAFAHIDSAAESGADVVKFQSFLADEMVAIDDDNYELLKKLEMPKEWYPELMTRCHERGVRFLSTATNFTSLEWMEEYGAWGYKVASCNITHKPLIDKLIEIRKPVFISTGLASLDEIKELQSYCRTNGLRDYTFLHCVSKYPTPYSSMRLKNISALKDMLDCDIGFSDHSPGINMPVAAVALGARVIEKHFSLDGNGVSPDHAVSLLPTMFSSMCKAIRETEDALVVDFSPDNDAIFKNRRSLHFVNKKNKGDVISDDDVKIIRPEDGMLPDQLNSVIGKIVLEDVEADQPITLNLLK